MLYTFTHIIMRKYVFTAIIASVTLTSCLSFFPNRYEKALIYNGFRANTNTGIATKVNIKGYYSIVKDSTDSVTVGGSSTISKSDMSTLAGYNPFILYEDGTYGNILFNAVEKDFSANEHYKRANMELDKECTPLNNIYLMRSGYYKLKEDTICVTTYIYYLLRTELVLLRYKIINSSHLLLLDETYISGNKNENDTCARNRIFEFIPVKHFLLHLCSQLKRKGGLGLTRRIGNNLSIVLQEHQKTNKNILHFFTSLSEIPTIYSKYIFLSLISSKKSL